MTIQEKLNEVNQYFVNKLIEGDYEFISCDNFTAKILIDNEYEFHLWIENNPRDSFDFYFFNENPMKLFKIKTQKERLSAWRKMKPLVRDYKESVILEEKKKELKKLQKELENL